MFLGLKNCFMNRSILFILIFFQSLSSFPNLVDSRPPTDANVFGHVVDAASGEHLPFVNLVVKGTRIGTITDASGHYFLTNLPEGPLVIQASSMGYAVAEVAVEAVAKTTQEIDIPLSATSITLSGVTLTASPTASGFRYQPDAVFMGEEIQRRSEPSFGEMLNGQPGVAMRSMGSAPARPVIRGMDGDRILVLENGERMGDISETSADHSISLDPLAASRVEVIRGPASLLYGSSALGGVINLMTTDIPDQWDPGWSGVASLQAASMNRMGAGFARVVAGGEEHAFSARMAWRQAGDITTPEGRIAGTSMRAYDGSLGWGVDKGPWLGGLSFSLSDQAFGIPEGAENPEEEVEIRANRMALQGRFGRSWQDRSFDQAQWRFNLSRFEQDEVELFKPADAPEEEAIGLSYEQYALSSTLTLQHKPAGVLDRGAVGFSWNAQQLDIKGDEAYTPGEQRLSVAAFSFEEVPLSNILRLQFGLRLDLQHSRALSNQRFPDAKLSRTSFNYSGSVGLNVRPFPGFELGAQLARSHRNPMVEELFADGAHLGAGVYEQGNVALSDEIGHGGDVFVTWERGAWQLELTGFVNDFANYIIFQPTGEVDASSGYDIYAYAEGKARLYGNEFQANWQASRALSWQTSIDWVRGRRVFDKSPNENLPFIPPLRWRNALEYDFGRAWMGAQLMLVRQQDQVAPGEAVTDGYALVGLQAGYRVNGRGRQTLILRVENLFDTAYRDHLSRIEDRNFVMPGRNFNLSWRWFF